MARLIYANRNDTVRVEAFHQCVIIPTVTFTLRDRNYKFAIAFSWLNIVAGGLLFKRRDEE